MKGAAAHLVNERQIDVREHGRMNGHFDYSPLSFETVQKYEKSLTAQIQD